MPTRENKWKKTTWKPPNNSMFHCLFGVLFSLIILKTAPIWGSCLIRVRKLTDGHIKIKTHKEENTASDV